MTRWEWIRYIHSFQLKNAVHIDIICGCRSFVRSRARLYACLCTNQDDSYGEQSNIINYIFMHLRSIWCEIKQNIANFCAVSRFCTLHKTFWYVNDWAGCCAAALHVHLHVNNVDSVNFDIKLILWSFKFEWITYQISSLSICILFNLNVSSLFGFCSVCLISYDYILVLKIW